MWVNFFQNREGEKLVGARITGCSQGSHKKHIVLFMNMLAHVFLEALQTVIQRAKRVAGPRRRSVAVRQIPES